MQCTCIDSKVTIQTYAYQPGIQMMLKCFFSYYFCGFFDCTSSRKSLVLLGLVFKRAEHGFENLVTTFYLEAERLIV